MIAPAPRRPSSGGGLAVLVVVTILAALAAPHATAVRALPKAALHQLLAGLPQERFDRLVDAAYQPAGTAA